MNRLRRAFRAIAVDAHLLRRRRELRLLMVGQGVSLLGSQITLVAVPVQMYGLTHSSLAVGLVGAAQFVPILALALVGGALADAFDRRRLMMVAEVGSLVVVLALAANAALPDPHVWVLYVASAPQISLRRSNASASAPPTSASATIGTNSASPSRPVATVECVSP